MLHVNQQALLEFAEKNVYWCGGERSRVDVSDVLQTILARKPRSVENEARRIFGFTDGDFREALKSTPPGMFLHRERWAEVNRRFHFDPPLPFPRRDIAAEWAMYNENKSMIDEIVKLRDLVQNIPIGENYTPLTYKQNAIASSRDDI